MLTAVSVPLGSTTSHSMKMCCTFLYTLLVLTSCAGDAVHTARDAIDGSRVHTVGGQVVYPPVNVVNTKVNKNVGHPRESVCPDAETIAPCVCTIDDLGMSLDCSDVESEDQLAEVMSSHFPTPDFRKFSLANNKNVKVLRAGVMGETSYQMIDISGGVLEEVEAGALSGSYSTVTDMTFPSNQISRFCWEELASYTELFFFDISDNKITSFPAISSDSLTVLDLSHNSLETVPVSAFSATPALSMIYLYSIGLKQIIPGTFSGLSSLSYVSLAFNQLTEVPEGAVTYTSSGHHVVYFNLNNISSVSANAISGMGGWDEVYMPANQLTVMEESVWRPLVEDNVYLYLSSNPLDCGCDIAWIMLNSTFLNHIDEPTTCADGRRMRYLDPAWYENNC